MNKLISGFILCAVLAPASHAAFIGRLETAPGSGIFQAYYDTQLDITWLANANLNGQAKWSDQRAWASALSIDGITGWRLPDIDRFNDNTAFPVPGDNCQSAATLQSDCAEREMSHLFWYGAGTTHGAGITPDNPGPFNNVQSAFYWYDNASDLSNAWVMGFSTSNPNPANNGHIGILNRQTQAVSAWAVHDGDVGAAMVPVPASAWLFGSALGLLGWVRRRKAA